MIKLVLLIIATVYSAFASANTFSPDVDVLPMSGKLFYAGANEPTVPPTDTAEGWKDVSGKFNLNAPGWYWLRFEAQSIHDNTTVIFQTNPSLTYFMFEKLGDSFVNIDQSRVFSAAEFWGDYRLNLESESPRHFYVKVKTSRVGYATGIDYSLATPEFVLRKRIQSFLPWLIFVGVVLCLITYNSYIFFQTRDQFYIYYICTEIFLHLIHMPALVFMWNWIFPRSVDYFLITGGGLLLGYLFIFLFLSRFARFSAFMPSRIKTIIYTSSLAFIPYGISLLIAKPVGVLLIGNIIAVLAMLGGVIYVALKSRSRNATILCFSFAPIPIAAAFYVVNRLLGNSNDVNSVYYLVSVLALEGIIMAIALADRIKQLEKRSREEETMRKGLEFELETAEVLQRLLLPAPLNAQGFRSQPYYRPARRNGGDWFTTYLDERTQTLYLAMIDVTGHGLTSAMLASFVSGTVMGELTDSLQSEDPKVKLKRLAVKVNQTLLGTAHKSGLLATGLFCAIEKKTGQLAFINCAHPPLAIENSDGFEFVPASGRRLGLEGNTEFQLETLQLTQSGRLFIYTDGLTENQGLSGKNLTQKRLLKLLTESKQLSPENVSKLIQNTIDSIWGSENDRDDATFLLVDWAK